MKRPSPGFASIAFKKTQQIYSLLFWPAGFRQPCFFSQLRINLGEVFPEPLVALPAQQGVLAVVLPAPVYVTFLLSGKSFFHPRLSLS